MQESDNASDYIKRGNVHWELKQYEEALAAYEQAIKLDPTSVHAYREKRRVLYKLKRYEEALVATERAIELAPAYASAYHAKGVVLRELKRYEEALAAFEQAIELDPASTRIYYNKGKTLLELKRYEEALAAFEQAIELDPTYAFAYHGKGIVLRKLRRYKEALVALERATELNPTDADAYCNKGITLYMELKRYEEALAAFERAIELDPKYVSAYHGKGIALLYLERYEEALEALERVIELEPALVDAYNDKGVALRELKRYEEALTVLEHAIRLDPTSARIYRNQGKTLQALKRDEEAQAAFVRAKELDSSLAHRNEGEALPLMDDIPPEIQIEERISGGKRTSLFCGQIVGKAGKVAIKILPKEESEDGSEATHFLQEVEKASILHHPNIARIDAYGQTREVCFVVTELIDAVGLHRYLQARGIIPEARFLIITHDIALGLSCAHHAGMTHGALKPENVLIGRDGSIKLTDFGIASVTKRFPVSAMALRNAHYCSPEQAQGKSVSSATDIYACGVMMYEMVTGRLPFEGETPSAVVVKQMQEQPELPSHLNHSLPAKLEEVIMHCLEKEPERRFRDGYELALALEGFDL